MDKIFTLSWWKPYWRPAFGGNCRVGCTKFIFRRDVLRSVVLMAELPDEFYREFDGEGNSFISRFLYNVPSVGPYSHMFEMGIGNALMAWMMRVKHGESAICRMYEVDGTKLPLDYSYFYDDFIELCRSKDSRLNNEELDSVGRFVWGRWVDESAWPKEGFVSLDDEKKIFLDDYFLRFLPQYAFSSLSMEGLVVLSVKAWLRRLNDGQSEYLNAKGLSWDRQYDARDMYADALWLAKRFGFTGKKSDIVAEVKACWEQTSYIVSGKKLAEKYVSRFRGRAVQPLPDDILKLYTESFLARHGYTGIYADLAREYFPKFLRGDLTDEEFLREVSDRLP